MSKRNNKKDTDNIVISIKSSSKYNKDDDGDDSSSSSSSLSSNSDEDYEDYDSCVGCGRRGKWRFCTLEFLCMTCRRREPYKIISRTSCLTYFPGLTRDILRDEVDQERIQEFIMKNKFKRKKKYPICHYYYLHEIKKLASQL